MTENNSAAVEQDTMLEEALGTPVETESRNYLTFVTDGLFMGVDARCVVEILNNYTITPLPMTPDYILGIFNMRGAIIPILDISLKLGKTMSEENLLVVINYEGNQVGILVDSVDQMVEIADNKILPMPSRSPQQLVSGMCPMPNGEGTLLILDCEQLLGHDEQ